MQADAEMLGDVIGRLKKVEGQISGIIRMIESGRRCDEVVTQISAASRALDRAGFRLIFSGMKNCITDPEASGSDYSEADMEKLFLKLA